MCEALRELMKDEIEEQKREAALEVRQEKSIELIRNLMETMKMTADQAMAAMKISDEDRKEYRARL